MTPRSPRASTDSSVRLCRRKPPTGEGDEISVGKKKQTPPVAEERPPTAFEGGFS